MSKTLRERIILLMQEAAMVGDTLTVDLCRQALAGLDGAVKAVCDASL